MTKRVILVVDDDPGLQKLVGLSLRRAGYGVITATTGEEGVEKVRTERPDLVLMDVMMPGIDGFEATKRIRRLPEGRHIPIIFLSAQSEVDATVRGLRIGGDDYVAKPVKIRELLARIEAHLRSAAPTMGQLLTVFGSKTGVGATTLAVSLAQALHNLSNKSVLLVDWQRPLGDAAHFLGLPEKHALELLLPQVNDLDEQAFDIVLREYLPDIWVLPGATDPASAGQMNREALAKADYVVLDGDSFFSWEDPPLVSKAGWINLCVLTPELTSIERAANAVGSVNVMAQFLAPPKSVRHSWGHPTPADRVASRDSTQGESSGCEGSDDPRLEQRIPFVCNGPSPTSPVP